jgi:hypothetical protein
MAIGADRGAYELGPVDLLRCNPVIFLIVHAPCQ